MKKIMFVLFTIITLGLFMIPNAFAREYSSEFLDKINLVGSVSKTDTDYKTFAIDNSFTTGRVTFQVFSNDGNNIFDLINFVYYTITLRYNTSSGLQSATFTKNRDYAYCNLPSGCTAISNVTMSWSSNDSASVPNNLVFNLTYKNTATTYAINSFVPNTYYNVGGSNYLGVFQNMQVNLCMDYMGTLRDNITGKVLQYNSLMINYDSNLVNQIVSNNTNTYANNMYYLEIVMDTPVNELPNFTCKYLELKNIWVNNVKYNYTDAISRFTWLGSNIFLYNNSANLFNNAYNNGNNYIINKISFRIADLAFQSSSYYNSNIGVRGYIENCAFNVSAYSNEQVYEQGYYYGYQDGEKTGEITGYSNGYNDGLNTSGNFNNLFASIVDVPLKTIDGVLNFEVMGVNLKGFFFGILTLILFVGVFRRFKE